MPLLRLEETQKLTSLAIGLSFKVYLVMSLLLDGETHIPYAVLEDDLGEIAYR